MTPRLILPLGPTENHAYWVRGSRRGLKPEALAWQQVVAGLAWQWRRDVGWRLPPVDRKIAVWIWVWWPDRRVRDPANLDKVLLDALTGVLWVDDQWVLPRHQDVWVNPEHPGLELALELLPEGYDPRRACKGATS